MLGPAGSRVAGDWVVVLCCQHMRVLLPDLWLPQFQSCLVLLQMKHPCVPVVAFAVRANAPSARLGIRAAAVLNNIHGGSTCKLLCC